MPPKLGIVAGSGALPRQLVDACRAAGRPHFVLALNGHTDRETTDGAEHVWLEGVAVGAILKALRSAECEELVLAGKIARPNFRAMNPVDVAGLRLLPRLIKAATQGDDAIFQTIVGFFEREGFRVVGVDAVLHQDVAPAGPFAAARPGATDEADIAKGIEVVRALGALDIGQACVVRDGHVVAVEAAEGTDAMLERCAGLRIEAPGGVLVKLTKPEQQRRVDLPTIGPRTVAGAAAAGLNGIAVEAGATLLVEREALVRAADDASLFLVGLEL
ncbi:MAG: UDP-2,3-diacylglucosamine diphosphatase LpxI [Alphaproteobacteria bacterium]